HARDGRLGPRGPFLLRVSVAAATLSGCRAARIRPKELAMATSLATYIAFPGNAREAFAHYKDVFGGDLQIVGYGEMPMPDMPFEPGPDDVAHGVLTMPGGVIAGADAMPSERDKPLR